MKTTALCIVTFLLGDVIGASTSAVTHSAVSPDGRNEIRLTEGETLAYSVYRDGIELVRPSRISLETVEQGALGGAVKSTGEEKRKVGGRERTPIYKKAEVDLTGNETRVAFGAWAVTLHARNDGVAWRFETAFGGTLTVKDEATVVAFPKGMRLCAAATDGFESSWESTYRVGGIGMIPPPKDEWIVYLPLTAVSPNGKAVCISESDLLDYPGLNFHRATDEPEALLSALAREPSKVKRKERHLRVAARADFIARTDGTRTFPWRVFILGDSVSDLVASDAVFALARPNAIGDIGWIRPGQVSWDWWNGWKLTDVDFKPGIDERTYRHYIDFAATNRIAYVILDEGWSKRLNLLSPRSEVNVPGLVRYGQERGVGVILWAACSELADRRRREEVFGRYAEMGVRGFKVDFMDRDDRLIENYLAETAADAARHRLILLYHGMHKPTGLSRTYPNILNYEGVCGLEQGHGRGGNKAVTANDPLVVYTRMLAGPLDYTPGAMVNRAFDAPKFDPSGPRAAYGTRCHQMALYPLFEAPVQMLCDSPSQYRRCRECTDFIVAVPTVWDETVGVAGTLGETAAVARRKDGDWWLGAITGWTPREIEIDTSFLGSGDWRMESFRDASDADVDAERYVHGIETVRAGSRLKISLARGGGFAARFSPVQGTSSTTTGK